MSDIGYRGGGAVYIQKAAQPGGSLPVLHVVKSTV
jgi:hypothetical protein